jgi:ribonucleoside-diphosphate reductase alpha chain
MPATTPRPSLQPTTYNPLIYSHIRVCPECSGPVVRNSGCITCRQCGWGRCG